MQVPVCILVMIFLAIEAVLLSPGHSSELQVAVTAPVKCESPVAGKVAGNFLPDGSGDNSPAESKGPPPPTSCGTDTSFSEAASSRRRGRGDTKQLHLAVFEPLEEVADGCPWIVWGRVDEFEKGPSTLDRVLAYARTGEIFDEKYQVVAATPELDHERHLAICSVSKYRGPPTRCHTVVVIKGQEIYLRGESERTSCPAPSIALRPSGSIDVQYKVITHDGLLVFALSVNDMLATKQGLLGDLITSKDSRESVTSVWLRSAAPLRDSKVLSAGWREAYDFDVYFYWAEANQNEMGVEATLRPMVSRLAVGSLVQYQGLDDAQRTRYASYFDLLIGDAIKAACHRWKQIDGININCL